jgi:hypothetical protein
VPTRIIIVAKAGDFGHAATARMPPVESVWGVEHGNEAARGHYPHHLVFDAAIWRLIVPHVIPRTAAHP